MQGPQEDKNHHEELDREKITAHLDLASLAFCTPDASQLLGRWEFYALNHPTEGFSIVSPTYGFTTCKGGRNSKSMKGPSFLQNTIDELPEELATEKTEVEQTPIEDLKECINLAQSYEFLGMYGFFHTLYHEASISPFMKWIQGRFDVAEPKERTDDNDHQVHFFLRRNSVIFGKTGKSVPAAPLVENGAPTASLVRRLSVTRISKLMIESGTEDVSDIADNTLKNVRVGDLIVTIEDGSIEGINLLATRCQSDTSESSTVVKRTSEHDVGGERKRSLSSV
eukprot:CFRG1269T1